MARIAGVARQQRGLSLFAFRVRHHHWIAVLLLVVLLGVWELAIPVFDVPTYILPAPSQVLIALWRGLFGSELARSFWPHVGFTLAEALLGFAIGGIVGLAGGTLLAQFPMLDRLLRPYVAAFQSLPKVALAPLFLTWLGFGMGSKVAITATLTFFPVLINTMAGLHAVEDDEIELMRSLQASRWQIFRMVQFPNALPYIFAGLDIAVVYSVLGAIVGELVGSRMGLGMLIQLLNSQMDIAGVFSILIVLAVMGAALSGAVNALRKRVLWWRPSERK